MGKSVSGLRVQIYHDFGDCLLVHIPRLFKFALDDPPLRQSVPELADLTERYGTISRGARKSVPDR